VLVVDDDPLTRKLMTRMLQRLGCIVTTAENGDVALSILLGGMHTPSSVMGTPATAAGAVPILEREVKPETKFTIVFLDNQMPILTGLEVVRRLRDMNRPDFVVGVTGTRQLRDLAGSSMLTDFLLFLQGMPSWQTRM
jgi:osomolarity two-component system, sensor histidine kinase SLN1